VLQINKAAIAALELKIALLISEIARLEDMFRREEEIADLDDNITLETRREGERVLRDYARRSGDVEMAKTHGDREQMLTELINARAHLGTPSGG
jgi:hypothetical protein